MEYFVILYDTGHWITLSNWVRVMSRLLSTWQLGLIWVGAILRYGMSRSRSNCRLLLKFLRVIIKCDDPILDADVDHAIQSDREICGRLLNISKPWWRWSCSVVQQVSVFTISIRYHQMEHWYFLIRWYFMSSEYGLTGWLCCGTYALWIKQNLCFCIMCSAVKVAGFVGESQ